VTDNERKSKREKREEGREEKRGERKRITTTQQPEQRR
jgi:hypothetical protein